MAIDLQQAGEWHAVASDHADEAKEELLRMLDKKEFPEDERTQFWQACTRAMDAERLRRETFWLNVAALDGLEIAVEKMAASAEIEVEKL